MVKMSVENGGAGISPANLPHVFARFMRTEEAKRGKVPGLGLGLFITKALVEAQGGKIWAESIPNQITTFAFTLPRARD
jgi:signal transduction histidine kinase